MPSELNEFVDWVVRQVERRVDLEATATRPLSSEVSWGYWVEHLARLALHRRVHVTAANTYLESLPPPMTEASDSDSDEEIDVLRSTARSRSRGHGPGRAARVERRRRCPVR